MVKEFNFSFENVKNNHPNMFKNFFGSSLKNYMWMEDNKRNIFDWK